MACLINNNSFLLLTKYKLSSLLLCSAVSTSTLTGHRALTADVVISIAEIGASCLGSLRPDDLTLPGGSEDPPHLGRWADMTSFPLAHVEETLQVVVAPRLANRESDQQTILNIM